MKRFPSLHRSAAGALAIALWAPAALASFLTDDQRTELGKDVKGTCLVAAQIAGPPGGKLTEVRLQTDGGASGGPAETLTTEGVGGFFFDNFAFVNVPKGAFRISLIQYQKWNQKRILLHLIMDKIVFGKEGFRVIPEPLGAIERGEAANELSGTCDGGFLWLGLYKTKGTSKVELTNDSNQTESALRELKSDLGASPWAAEIDKPAKNTPLPEGKDLTAKGPAPMPKPPKIGVKATVVDRGGEPRVELRYAPKEGTKRTAVFTALTGNKPGSADPLPHLNWMLDTTVAKAADKSVRFDYLVTGTKPEETSDKMSNMVATMMLNGNEGITGFVEYSDRGVPAKAELKFAPGKEPKIGPPVSVVSSVANTVIPLPTEPVGPGASWEVLLTADKPTFHYEQSTVYKLVSNEGGVLKISITQDARTSFTKPLQIPQPDGSKKSLAASVSSGTGEARVNLAQALPDFYRLALASDSLFAGGAEPAKDPKTPSGRTETQVEAK